MNFRLAVKRHKLVFIDVILIILAWLIVSLLVPRSIRNFLLASTSYLAASLIIRFAVRASLKLYKHLWQYARVTELQKLAGASILSTLILLIGGSIVAPLLGFDAQITHFVFMLDSIFNLLFLFGSRLFIRNYHRRKSGEASLQKSQIRTPKRVLIVGIKGIGEIIARHLSDDPGLGMQVVGFIDNDSNTHNRLIHGIPVLGNCDQLPQFITHHNIDQLLVSDTNAWKHEIRSIKELSETRALQVSSISDLSMLFGNNIRKPAAVKNGHVRKRASFKNVLVTGGAGFIGSNFVHYMLETHPKYRIVILDKLTYAGNLDNLKGLAERYGARYVFEKGDICDAEEVRHTLEEYEIDCIVNFAAETHVDRSLIHPGQFERTNVYGTYVLLDQVIKLGIPRFHQISTDEVYGEILHGSFKETDPLDPGSPYSASKAGADMMCLAYSNSYGLNVTMSRGSNNIGPFQHLEKVVPLFVTNALNDDPLPLYGDGLYERDYQYVRDHCAGIDRILHYGLSGEVFNIGSGEETKAVELATMICDILRKPYSLICHVEDRPGQDRRYSLDCTRIVALGWTPESNTRQALEQTVRWYVENRWWWEPLRNGEFKSYYEQHYAQRLKGASQAFKDLPAVF